MKNFSLSKILAGAFTVLLIVAGFGLGATPKAQGAFDPTRDVTWQGLWNFSNAFGYGNIPGTTGVGGTVTQLTNRTTGVTLHKLTGQITTNNASLAVETAAEFTVTNNLVAIGDVVVVSQQSGSNSGNTDVFVSTVANGSFKIKVADNNAAAGTAETGAIIINFAVIKAVAL